MNLISITDGQIYLSPSLFELGVLPAQITVLLALTAELFDVISGFEALTVKEK